MGFWTDALERLGDNARLVGAAALDWVDPWAGADAPRTAAEVERQAARDEGRAVDAARVERMAQGGAARIGAAASRTGAQVGAVVDEAASVLASPWLWAAVATVAVAWVAWPALSASRAAVAVAA